MNIEAKKSLLWDAFEELKLKWSVDERILERLDEEEEPTVDGLPESRINDLIAIKNKYQLDDVDFLFIVGAAVGLYEGQRNVRNVVKRKIKTVNEFVSSVIGKK
ncbi:MAG TPA: hypothetical protein EYP30_03355 [Archaeoglobaceae archaeon]|nr:hypothetical protein [Archaeoglobaceae archaeon]